jgi:meso-butanediol dehydrogenase/(S,S)-butanediol dehydrogenase/diacetyl reductase
MGKFTGKTIVVTGSGKEKGLGQGILQAFADEGANCVVSDLAMSRKPSSVRRLWRNQRTHSDRWMSSSTMRALVSR